MDANTKHNNNIITPRWRSVANYIIIIMIPVQGPNSARAKAAAVTKHTRPCGSFVRALQIDIVRCYYYYIHNIRGTEKTSSHILYLHDIHTRVQYIIILYMHTHTRAHISHVARL